MAEKRKPVKLTWRQWGICYFASLGGGGAVWYLTDNVWLGGGVMFAITMIYIFYLSGRAIQRDKGAEVDVSTMSRQQRRAHERKNNK